MNGQSFRGAYADDTQPRGHDVQRFADILADAHPQGATAGIACVFGFDDDLDAGQMPRQGITYAMMVSSEPKGGHIDDDTDQHVGD